MVATRWAYWMLLQVWSLCFVDVVVSFAPKSSSSVVQRTRQKPSFGITQTSRFPSFPFRLDPCWASPTAAESSLPASSPQNKSSSAAKNDDITEENETNDHDAAAAAGTTTTTSTITADVDLASDEIESPTSTSPGSTEPLKSKTKSNNDNNINKSSEEKDRQYDLPWTDLQQWALCDQLPKYTVQVPSSYGGSSSSDDESSDVVTLKVLTLWRTMSNEVIELSGYPVEFLVERQMELQEQAAAAASTTTTATTSEQQDGRRPPIVRTSRTVLPYLDDFDFTPSGGLSGIVSGIKGVANGCRIETAPVGDVHSTIPKGYVRAGSVLYELGRPRQEQQLENRKKLAMDQPRSLAGSLTQQLKDTASKSDMPVVVEQELVQLGALTAIIVTGAAAFETLSHHLTVNVFWV